jgi:hypothetical protein
MSIKEQGPPPELSDEEQLERAIAESKAQYALERHRWDAAAPLRMGDANTYDDLYEPDEQAQAPAPPPPPPAPPIAPTPAPVPVPPPVRGSPARQPARQQQQQQPPVQQQHRPSPPKKGKGRANGAQQVATPPRQQQQQQQPTPAQQQHKPQQQPWQQAWQQQPRSQQQQQQPAPPAVMPARPPQAQPPAMEPSHDPSEALVQQLLAQTAAQAQAAQPFAGLQGGLDEDEAMAWAVADGGQAQGDPDELRRREEEELRRVEAMSVMEQKKEEERRAKLAAGQVLRKGGAWGARDNCVVWEVRPSHMPGVEVLCGAEGNQLEHFRQQFKVSITPHLEGNKKSLELRPVQRQTALALFDPRQLEAMEHTLDIAKAEVKLTLQAPEARRRERLETNVHVFVDWSNIVLGAQPKARDHRVHLDVRRFAALLQADRNLVKGFVSGSDHHFYEQVRARAACLTCLAFTTYRCL